MKLKKFISFIIISFIIIIPFTVSAITLPSIPTAYITNNKYFLLYEGTSSNAYLVVDTYAVGISAKCVEGEDTSYLILGGEQPTNYHLYRYANGFWYDEGFTLEQGGIILYNITNYKTNQDVPVYDVDGNILVDSSFYDANVPLTTTLTTHTTTILTTQTTTTTTLSNTTTTTTAIQTTADIVNNLNVTNSILIISFLTMFILIIFRGRR